MVFFGCVWGCFGDFEAKLRDMEIMTPAIFNSIQAAAFKGRICLPAFCGKIAFHTHTALVEFLIKRDAAELLLPDDGAVLLAMCFFLPGNCNVFYNTKFMRPIT